MIIKRLEHPQTGVRFELKICKGLFASSHDVRELVKLLENKDFAQRVLQAFTMPEAPTISSLQQLFPSFKVKFLGTEVHDTLL
jgi:hypothetical protein